MPDLADVLDDDGIPDPEKTAVRAEQLAEWKPGLRKVARVPNRGFGQAAGRPSTKAAVSSEGAVLRGIPGVLRARPAEARPGRAGRASARFDTLRVTIDTMRR